MSFESTCAAQGSLRGGRCRGQAATGRGNIPRDPGRGVCRECAALRRELPRKRGETVVGCNVNFDDYSMAGGQSQQDLCAGPMSRVARSGLSRAKRVTRHGSVMATAATAVTTVRHSLSGL